MKMRKRIVVLLCSIITVLNLLPVQVFAAGGIDPEKSVKLTISYQDQKTVLAGAKFDLYFVAAMDAYGELTPTESFSQFNVDIHGENEKAWRTLASTLEGYVLRDSVAVTDSGKTDQQGNLVFPTGQEKDGAKKLQHGLYLVMGHRHTQNGYIYETEPFMVLLPGADKENNAWDYEVTASPKKESRQEPKDDEEDTVTRKVLKVWKDSGNEKNRPKEVIVQLLRDGKVCDTVTLNEANNWRYSWSGLAEKYRWTVAEKEVKDYTVTVTLEGVTFVVTNTYGKGNPSVTPTAKPGGSKLPQTGQLWWPVPILLVAGLFLVVIGLLYRKGGRYEE